MSERETLIETLARHRGFLLQTAEGLSEEQARTRSTVSQLTIAGLLKHVADTEQQWFAFAVQGVSAFGGGGVYGSGVDWESLAAETAADQGDDPAQAAWQDDRFTVGAAETLTALRDRLAEVATRTEQILREADLDGAHPLPEAPWFEPGVSWSVRRVALHMLAEISQHAGHADIIREAIDGQRTMG
jgi:uncharacterized damage-inducible protein DinB